MRILIWVYVNFQWFKKLCCNLTLGRLIWELIIVWLYCHLQMSNGDMYEKNHDELDFEFLGNIRGKEWRVQTNVYGNGSTDIGREERYTLWFDPAEEFHRYSILWTEEHIMYSLLPLILILCFPSLSIMFLWFCSCLLDMLWCEFFLLGVSN